MSAYTSADGVLIALEDGVLSITLDRPGKRNAIDDAMMSALIDAVDAAGRDDAVRAVLLGATGPHFCAGADIVSRNAAGPEAPEAKPRVGSIQRRLPSQAHRLVPLLLSVQVPVVAGIRGWAAGIGLSLALCADVTVAAQDACFWAPFCARGFTPDSGLTWLLPRRVGEVRARRMLLLDEKVDAAQAVEWGLVDRVVPSEDTEKAAAELAARFASGATVALGLTKWLMHSGTGVALGEQLRDEGFAMELSSRSRDFREGLAAFREKRPARFEGL